MNHSTSLVARRFLGRGFATSRFVGFVFIGAVLATTTNSPSTAFAQDFARDNSEDDQKLAMTLAREGNAARTKGNRKKACKKYKESHRAAPSILARIGLGWCAESDGDFPAAWNWYTLARIRADAQNKRKLSNLGREQADKLKSKVAIVRISVPDQWRADDSGAELEIDGTPVPREQWSADTAVTPGRHKLSARAPGMREWNKKVKVKSNRDAKLVKVEFEADDVDSSGESGDGSSDNSNNNKGEPKPETIERSSGSTKRLVGIGLVGVGVVLAGVGTFAGLDARKKWSDVKDCEPTCTDEQRDLGKTARTRANISSGAFIGAAALTGVGLWLWLSSSDTSSEGSNAVVIAPSLGPDFAIATFSGRF